MLEIILIVCVTVLLLIVFYLLFFFNKKSKQDKINAKEEKIPFYNFSHTPREEIVEAILSVNNEHFFFSYDRKYSDEIKILNTLIRESFSIIEDSKYRDIIESRLEEITKKLKRLTEISTLKKEEFDTIKVIIKNYTQEIK